MPPKRSNFGHTRENQEGRLILAIKALKPDKNLTVRGAASLYDVPKSTLRDRCSGKTDRTTTRANGHRLTLYKEDALSEWISIIADLPLNLPV